MHGCKKIYCLPHLQTVTALPREIENNVVFLQFATSSVDGVVLIFDKKRYILFTWAACDFSQRNPHNDFVMIILSRSATSTPNVSRVSTHSISQINLSEDIEYVSISL